MLSTISAATFAPLEGQTVTVTTSDGHAIPMTVGRAKEVAAAVTDGRRLPFTVLLSAEADSRLEADTCTVDGDGFDRLTVFVNRVTGLSPDKAWYQIAFN